MATQTVNASARRITYPLDIKEVEELQALEAQLRTKAEAAQKNNRVGLHRAYTQLMKSTTSVVTRERNRMSREAMSQYNKAQRELQRIAKSDPNYQQATQDNP
jgi:hypothetical protein